MGAASAPLPPDPAAPTTNLKGLVLEHENVMDARQDPAEESVEARNVRQQVAVERLSAELLQAQERSKASLHLVGTVVGTVQGLALQMAEIATSAFDFTDSVETLVARTGQLMSELEEIQTEAETGQLDVQAARLLSRQLRKVAAKLEIQAEQAEDADLGRMRSVGEEERRDVEDRRRQHENDRREVEDDRREREDSIFEENH